MESVSSELSLRRITGAVQLSPEMALGLKQVGTGSVEFWLSMQASYDLFQHRNNRATA